MSKYIVRQVIVTEVEAETADRATMVARGEIDGYLDEIECSISAKLRVDPVDRVTAGMQQFIPFMQTVADLINGTTSEPEPKTQRPPAPIPPREVPDLEVDTTDIDDL